MRSTEALDSLSGLRTLCRLAIGAMPVGAIGSLRAGAFFVIPPLVNDLAAQSVPLPGHRGAACPQPPCRGADRQQCALRAISVCGAQCPAICSVRSEDCRGFHRPAGAAARHVMCR